MMSHEMKEQLTDGKQNALVFSFRFSVFGRYSAMRHATAKVCRDSSPSGTASRIETLSTLIGRSKNVRKRKKRKVDRGFQGVARGGALHFFVWKVGSSECVKQGRRPQHR